MHAPYAQNRPTELGRTNQAILMKTVERMRGNGYGVKHANDSPLPHSMQMHHLKTRVNEYGVLGNNSVLGKWGLQKKKGRR